MRNETVDMFYCFFKSPIGTMRLVSANNAIISVSFIDMSNMYVVHNIDGCVPKLGMSHVLKIAVEQLERWFKRERVDFDLPLRFYGTVFQKIVWESLRFLRFGNLISYNEYSSFIGMPKSCRAVSQAISRNPILIINPCHRVVSAKTELSGFSGGLYRKQQLLNHEGHLYKGCFKNSKI